jgi:hypothetical protein
MEVKREIKTYSVDLLCDHCGWTMKKESVVKYLFNSIHPSVSSIVKEDILPRSYTKIYTYQCTGCGMKMEIDKDYPRIEYQVI